MLDRTRYHATWRWPIPESCVALERLAAAGMAMGVVSNASGQIEAMLARGARRWSGAVHTPPIAASACLAIAERLFAAGRTTAPEALLPTYPREPEAVTLWNLRHREGSGRSG